MTTASKLLGSASPLPSGAQSSIVFHTLTIPQTATPLRIAVISVSGLLTLAFTSLNHTVSVTYAGGIAGGGGGGGSSSITIGYAINF